MSTDQTPIEWADATWNPVRGCSRVSPGCEHCYAEQIAARFSGSTFAGFARHAPNGESRWTGKLALVPEALEQPLRWRRPRRIFVNSMSDLFHEALPGNAIAAVFGVMMLAPQHTYLVLTKRAARMRAFLDTTPTRGWVSICVASAYLAHPPLVARAAVNGQDLAARTSWPLSNVHLGVSVENQATADDRIPLLLTTPAAVHWISAEPLLGPITLDRFLYPMVTAMPGRPGYGYLNAASHVGDSDFEGTLDWVVAGGESGTRARPFHLAWARSLRDQCVRASCAYFWKQHGTWRGVEGVPSMLHGEKSTEFKPGLPLGAFGKIRRWEENGTCRGPGAGESTDFLRPGIFSIKLGKKEAGRELDGRTWDELPQTRPIAEG